MSQRSVIVIMLGCLISGVLNAMPVVAQEAVATATPTATDTATSTATATPTAAWPTDTATPWLNQTATAAFDCRDLSEPNYEPGSGPTLVMGQTVVDLTLSPLGDVDFFSLWAKAGQLYQLTTGGEGVDTRLRIYNPSGELVAENDDYKAGSVASQLTFQAASEGWYEVAVDSAAPVDHGCRKYTLMAVTVAATPTPTATTTPTRAPSATAIPTGTPPPTAVAPEHIKPDDYEPNPNLEQAANIGVGQTVALNFNGWPAGNNEVDNDFFRLYVKQSDRLLIETTNLAEGLDTNVIVYKADGGVAAGNDDCQPGERRSCLTWEPGYDGLAFVLVGPVGTIPDGVAAGSRAYELTIAQAEAGGSGPSASGWGWSSPGNDVDGAGADWGSGGGSAGSGNNVYGQALPWKVTPLPPTATPMAVTGTLAITATPVGAAGDAGAGLVQVRSYSLIPPPPTPRALQPIGIEVTIYYDENDNRATDASEGVGGISVRVLDAATNRPLAQTFTDNQGHATLSLSAGDDVRLSISYLGYNKTIKPPGGVFSVRLPALRVPSLIP